MDSLHRHIMGFGSVGELNPQSMHYKYIKIGDERVPVRVSPCYCMLINQNRSIDDKFVECGYCREAERELKPHYKWDWKLNKAVRL